MQINVSIGDIESIDLSADVGSEIVDYDHETGATETRGKTLGDLVAEKLAEKIYGTLDYQERKALTETVAMERVRVVREKLEPLVEQALIGDIQKTNAYGEPTGATTTMKELVIAEVTRVLKGSTDRHSTQKPLLREVVNTTVTAALKADLDKIFAAEKEKVVAAVQAQASTLIADAVKKGLGGR